MTSSLVNKPEAKRIYEPVTSILARENTIYYVIMRMPVEERQTVKLVYIHGFQGDHTSFQSFPTDLHETLQGRLPSSIQLESCLYPTYKSRKPISDAAKKFISWLDNQSPGPVILLAHSMGGLLAADVATDVSITSKRVIGLVFFDVPFLGMHPHVVISGIASLLPKEDEKLKTEEELNDCAVVRHIVDSTSELDQDIELDPSLSTVDVKGLSNLSSTPSQLSLPSPIRSSLPSGSQLDIEWENHKASFYPRSPSLTSPFGRPLSSTSAKSTSSDLSTDSSSKLSLLSPLSSSITTKLERVADRLVSQSDHPFMRWLRKHSDSPFRAMTTWIIEHFQFGVCMFDPPGLKERYNALEHWGGPWINFWTETSANGDVVYNPDGHVNNKVADEADKSSLPNNTAEIGQFVTDNENHLSETYKHARAAEKSIRKERDAERKSKKPRPARHFIVLPHMRNACSDSWHFGSRERWERVQILNAEDEVKAHCGIFIRDLNPEYDQLVKRVADIIERWCMKLTDVN